MSKASRLFGSVVLVLAGAAGVPAAVAAAAACPPVTRLVWKAPQRIRWQMEETPLWFSLGHQARVMCFIPVGWKEEGGKVVETFDGSGRVTAIRIELHDVLEFEPKSAAPRETRVARTEVLRADDVKARERKSGWGFPSEQGKDFEFSLIPALEWQALLKLYRHEEAPFWSTLLVHAEASTEALAGPLAEASGSAGAFQTFHSHTIVCELLNDPSVKMTSTYLEPDDPPSTNWIAGEAVRAPWSEGKAALEPARGSLEFEGGKMRFAAFNEKAAAAAALMAKRQRDAGVPNLSISFEKDRGGPEEDLMPGAGATDD